MKTLNAALLLAALAATGLGASACKKHDQSQQQQAPQQGDVDINTQLTELLKERTPKPSKLVAKPNIIFMELQKGGKDSQTVRLTVEDANPKADANRQGTLQPIAISAVTATTNQQGLVLGGDCVGKKIAAGDACDIVVNYQDMTGRPIDAQILVTSDAVAGPKQLVLQFSVDVAGQPIQAPPPPGCGQSGAPACPPAAPAPVVRSSVEPAILAEIAAINAKRAAGGFGHADNGANGMGGFPTASTRSQDKQYDPNLFPSLETTLPVDRARILTADRTIKAVLETPITNVMCQRVVAVTESPTYSPDTRNILIPDGTRFIGHCAKLVDQRVAIAWTRFITPDGVSARIKADSADAMGRGGVPGYLDHRYWDRFGLPLLFSAFQATAEAYAGGNSTTNSTFSLSSGLTQSTTSARQQAIQQFEQNTQQVSQQFVQDFADVRPIVTIPGGTRMDIDLNEDIYFKSPQEVVSLNDVQYDLRRKQTNPTVTESDPPGIGVAPAMGADQSGFAMVIDGKTFNVTPAAGGIVGQAGAALGLTGSNGVSAASGQNMVPPPPQFQPYHTPKTQTNQGPDQSQNDQYPDLYYRPGQPGGAPQTQTTANPGGQSGTGTNAGAGGLKPGAYAPGGLSGGQ